MPTSPKTATDLFDRYRRDHEAALEPCIDCLLRYCPEGELEALNVLLDDYLLASGSPPYSPVQMRRLSEKVQPVIDRVMADPSWLAQDDQIAAKWRDTPWIVKRYRRARFAVLCVRLRWQVRRSPKRWE